MLMEFLGLSRRSSLDNPRVSLNDVEAWNDLFGTSDTDSGVSMNHDKALGYSPVWQAVSLISGDVAKLPLEVFKRGTAEGRDADKQHPAYKLVRRKANREMSAFRFWRRLMVHALLWNNAYAFIDRDGAGRPLELFPLLPDRTAPHRVGGQLWYVTEVNGQLKPFPAYDVLHIEGIAHESMEGADLVEKARNDFALGLAAIKFQSKFFKHGVRTGGILEIPAGTSKPARDKLVEGFEKHHEGPDNWFKTVVLRDGAKFHQTSIPPGEAQMIETRKEQRRDVASWFNLPLHKVGLDGNSGYNSLESEKQSYLDSALSHWIETISSECWMKLLTKPEQDNDSHFFEHNTGALVKADVATRYRNYNIGITAGILCPDEARAKENMPPRPDGKGGEYRLPLNMAVSSKKADAAPDDPEKEGIVVETQQEIQTDPASTLNGSQIASATEIVSKVALGELPRDAAIGMLVVLLNLSAEQAEQVMGSVGKSFSAVPPPPDPPPQDPPPDNQGERSQRLDAVQRQLLVDAVGRMLRRITVHARKAAKAEESYRTWLSVELDGHRSVVDAAIGPALEALAISRRNATFVRATAVDRFFASVRQTLVTRHDQADAACARLDAADSAIADQLLAG